MPTIMIVAAPSFTPPYRDFLCISDKVADWQMKNDGDMLMASLNDFDKWFRKLFNRTPTGDRLQMMFFYLRFYL